MVFSSNPLMGKQGLDSLHFRLALSQPRPQEAPVSPSFSVLLLCAPHHMRQCMWGAIQGEAESSTGEGGRTHPTAPGLRGPWGRRSSLPLPEECQPAWKTFPLRCVCVFCVWGGGGYCQKAPKPQSLEVTGLLFSVRAALMCLVNPGSHMVLFNEDPNRLNS